MFIIEKDKFGQINFRLMGNLKKINRVLFTVMSVSLILVCFAFLVFTINELLPSRNTYYPHRF